MSSFKQVFDKAGIYNMLFFNIKTVLEYPTLKDLEVNNLPMFKRWKYLYETKHSEMDNENLAYESNAVYYSEFAKIVAISYATVYVENGTLKRDFKKIINFDERVVIETFFDELRILSNTDTQSTPQIFPTLCGHNIINHDIPTLIKRFVLLNSKEKNSSLPYILKRSLYSKPWESDIIDIVNIWKFNGFEHTSLMLISDFLGLKKVVDLLPLDELSKYFWKNINENPKETLDFVGLQSATQTNLVIQLMNELRQV